MLGSCWKWRHSLIAHIFISPTSRSIVVGESWFSHPSGLVGLSSLPHPVYFSTSRICYSYLLFFYRRISPIVVVRLFSFSYPTRSALKDQRNVDESYVKYDISVDISRLGVFVFSLNIRSTIRSEMAVIENGRRMFSFSFPSLITNLLAGNFIWDKAVRITEGAVIHMTVIPSDFGWP